MITVYKYPIDINDTVEFDIQGFIRCLKVACVKGEVFLWTMVDTENKQNTPVSFEIRGTGHDCESVKDVYLDTIFQEPFVWHIFVKQAYRWQWIK